jgi:hypothetical protein
MLLVKETLAISPSTQMKPRRSMNSLRVLPKRATGQGVSMLETLDAGASAPQLPRSDMNQLPFADN